jgi:hypothetical protein
MSIYPNRKKNAAMIQVAGNGSQVRAKMEGAERIYSRQDTKKIMTMAKKARSQKDIIALGKFVAEATQKQDSREPEFVSA